MYDELNKYYVKMIKTYTELGYNECLIGQWTLPLQDAQTLAEIIQVLRPRNILEVGTFVGLTTLLMAMFSPPETHIHSIDPNFPLQVEMGSMKCKLDDSDTSIKSQDLALRAAKRLGVEHKITFHAGGFSTDNTFASYNLSPASRINIIGPEICKSFGPFDFIFIDGLHYEEDVFSDLNLAVEHLVPSGSIAMHDILGAWGSNVRRAVFRFLEKQGDFFLSHGKYYDICDSIGLLQHFPQDQEQSQFVKKNNCELKNGGLIQDKMFPNLGAGLINMFSPSSVIQIGGNIALLEQMANSGVSEVCALHPQAIQHSFIPIKQFNPHTGYQFEKKYDLCLCLDITDSFSEDSFEDVIQACIEASDKVIFACTPPGELGYYQCNDKPLTYWLEKFHEKGYLFWDVIRPVLEPINFSDIIHSEYQVISSYLMNLYLVKRYDETEINKASFLKNIIIDKERRIEDLCLQLLYKNNILNYYKNKTDDYKKSEKNLIDIINNQNERLDTINIFNKEIINNTVKRVREIIGNLLKK